MLTLWRGDIKGGSAAAARRSKQSSKVPICLPRPSCFCLWGAGAGPGPGRGLVIVGARSLEDRKDDIDVREGGRRRLHIETRKAAAAGA